MYYISNKVLLLLQYQSVFYILLPYIFKDIYKWHLRFVML